MKLWKGRFKKEADPRTNDFNSSIAFDSRMYRQDIEGSIAHATMLGRQGIIDEGESMKICVELGKILEDLDSGALAIDPDAEDIHTFVEQELTARIGDAGKRLHTGRSRNDQVALDIRLTLREDCNGLLRQLKDLGRVLCQKADQYSGAVMPGYTHMQRAQPVTFGHHLMAYAEMVLRDISRFEDALRRMDLCPLGSGALAGTTYPLERELTAKLLGFTAPTQNSLDGVSDRDFCAEIAFAASLCMVHLSRLCEELVLWCSWEFKFIELDDAYCTGSSIMPQKKNPDLAELIRGKSGRVIGDLTALLTMLKGLPLAYNKDMQEDKEAVFDAVDSLKLCLTPLIPMLETMKVLEGNMRKAAAGGFINATDCADYLVSLKGLPFRDAYKITGELVALCLDRGLTLETLPLEEYRRVCPAFDEGVFAAISLEKCVGGRKVLGGPAPENVKAQARRVLDLLERGNT
ncbi:argininosuccinate lyase [Acutalibacter sp. 1XD8-33]|uniref:argininosuccinate lyase n=1 Tax=Acutalibacter sp. 1XD8-33 TaxID=2320081 RepID=UPI000EA10E14|nr:argininosuccinate lyase [Acutalibacter sp. 1XD8-33]RKJ39876.1 argininosuccinate lyase [Acutalibacter sp. 1XD8-33]